MASVAVVATYKKQESVLILLNLAVLAALFFVHIVFLSVLGRPTWSLLIVLAIRFAILIVELIWVQRLNVDNEWLIEIHAHVSVVLTILEVWIYFNANPPVDVSEYFEAATVSLLFLVVAIVVRLLVGNLRSEEEKLSESLAELRRLQERLVAEEKLAAIGQLSSAIAHEIRNPVSMIASSLKMAEGRGPGSPVAQEMFDIATTESKRLETLTSDFLAFARTKEPQLKATPVRASLDYLAGLSKALAAEKELSIEIVCDDRLEFTMDADQMHRAMLNLLTNALNATPRHGRVVIGAEKDGGRSTLYVENTGPKIPDEIVSRIFEPFFTSGPKGTGLGLPIVRKIAHSHGGEVFLAGNEDGRVRFEIQF
jgi:signal transduction histidine kinase